jgi:hypothetical protein
MQVLNRKPDALDRLLAMSPEDGAAMLNQLFNPMRGLHVGTRRENRSTACDVVKEEQNKI